MRIRDYRRSITNLILVVLFFAFSFLLVNSNDELIHRNGMKALKEIVFAMFNPDLSNQILIIGIKSVFQTLAYAATGISLAVIVGFLLSIPASEIFKEKKTSFNFAKNILSFMRGIHEIIWAWFFVASIGLSPFSAVFAITIPYAGTLGKIFSDIIRNADKAPLNSLKKSGASVFQQIIYGLIPQSSNQFKSYIFYRFECAIRSSAILSFIGLGGLGYQINISMQDLKYNEVWTFVYILVLVVVFVDYLGKKSRDDQNIKIKKISLRIISFIFISSWLYLIFYEKISIFDLFTLKNLKYSSEFLMGLLGFATQSSPYLDISIWKNLFRLAFETLQMSVIAISIASIAMILTISFGIKKEGNTSILRKILYSITNGIYIFTRTVPELIWAVILIFIFKPGILPGAIALGIHNFGILGKLCSELVEDFDDTPSKALVKSGASKIQAFLYGSLPNIYPRVISYIMYRFEVIVRTSIVVGVVGAGGLGEIFKLSMSFFHYGEVGMIIIVYLIIVSISDFLSVKAQEFNS